MGIMSRKQKLGKEMTAYDLTFNKLISEIESYLFPGN